MHNQYALNLNRYKMEIMVENVRKFFQWHYKSSKIRFLFDTVFLFFIVIIAVVITQDEYNILEKVVGASFAISIAVLPLLFSYEDYRKKSKVSE